MKLTVKLVDSFGRSGRKVYDIEPAVLTLADAITASNALLADLAAVTDAGIAGYAILYENNTEVQAAAAGSNLDEGLTMVTISGDGSKDIVKVPCPKSGMFVAGTDVLAIDDTDILAFLANFATAGSFQYSDGENFVSLVSGKLDR
jgi:hypothetical protein